MSIIYNEELKVFKLDTPNTSYLIGIVDEKQYVGHIYYGKYIHDVNVLYLLRTNENPFVPSVNGRDTTMFLDGFPTEYPTFGVGDFRDACLQIETIKGHKGSELHYISHNIVKGKPKLQGLPATFGNDEECDTLELACYDAVLQLKVILRYTAFSKVDAITRSVEIINQSEEDIYLKRVLSTCIDMDNKAFDLITLHGGWARERRVQRREIGYGKQSTSSFRGESGHQDHPFMALAAKHSTQDVGDVYGFNFVYSGNFIAQAELNQYDMVRVLMGINPEGFSWKLSNNQSFIAPEVVMVYSDQGLNGMTQIFHNVYRNHLIRGMYKDKKRPILINNWEATYFNFDTPKLLAIAKEAAQVGIEMLVMDDGWFGNRSSDNSALGDWIVNEEKLQGGLNYLVDEVNKIGLKFGIWFEPEMISPDSDLYRQHPDWAIQIPGRTASLSRNQYVLDLSRKEVRDYIYDSVSTVLKSANIEYVKWDMNRQLTDLGSSALTSDCQGELYHRYVLAVYELQERLTSEFPHVLIENCSGGGARFDPGMLYYSPQIWCSDDTDAIERLAIQEGTAMIYPLSSIGAHISDCPNHTVGRITPFETRGYVALAGTFGYELDITKIPEEDKQMIPQQIEMYHKYNDLIREGDYYRIASYVENHLFDCWQVVSKNKDEALLTYIQVMNRANTHSRRVCFKGLSADTSYRIEGSDMVLTGSALMHAGINLEKLWGDFKGQLIHLLAEK